MKFISGLVLLIAAFGFVSCSSKRYMNTVEHVEIERFMGDWYVLAYRPIFLERNAFNALEQYSFNKEKDYIDVTYTFNKGGFDGEQKRYTQTGKVLNKDTNAHWLVSPFWPLEFDYLVIALDEHYEWTVIGVPSGKYIWLMARDYRMPEKKIDAIMQQVDKEGYPAKEFSLVPHRY